MGSSNQKLALPEAEKHVIYSSDSTFCSLPFELFWIIACYTSGGEKISVRLVSRWFYNASQRVLRTVLDANEIEAVDQEFVGCYIDDKYSRATYLELSYNPSPAADKPFVPQNTFKLTLLDGPQANAPELNFTGQWVACASLEYGKPQFQRPIKGHAKQVRLMFDAGYHVKIAEDSLYADRSCFQWNGKERVQSAWKFSVSVRSDGTVFGGGRGFGCLQQTFTGTWRDGIVDMMCHYADDSTASFVGSYKLCDVPAPERQHSANQQAFALEMTVTMVSLGSILEKAQVVQCGDSGHGSGVYVPCFVYEGILKRDRAPGFGENEEQYTLIEENVSPHFSYYDGKNLHWHVPMGRVEQTVRLHQRRLLGTSRENPDLVPIYVSSYEPVNPLFDHY